MVTAGVSQGRLTCGRLYGYLQTCKISLIVQLLKNAGPAGGAFKLIGEKVNIARDDDKSRSIKWRRRFDEVRDHQNAKQSR